MDATLYLPITSLAAVVNGALLLAMTLAIGMTRRKTRISLGDGGDAALHMRIRGHANGVEQIPIALILLALAEIQGAGDGVLWLAAALLTLGRLGHAWHFWNNNKRLHLRFYGVILTSLAQLILLVSLVGLAVF